MLHDLARMTMEPELSPELAWSQRMCGSPCLGIGDTLLNTFGSPLFSEAEESAFVIILLETWKDSPIDHL